AYVVFAASAPSVRACCVDHSSELAASTGRIPAGAQRMTPVDGAVVVQVTRAEYAACAASIVSIPNGGGTGEVVMLVAVGVATGGDERRYTRRSSASAAVRRTTPAAT